MNKNGKCEILRLIAKAIRADKTTVEIETSKTSESSVMKEVSFKEALGMIRDGISVEEVKDMEPEDFIGTYTYCFGGYTKPWIQYNERIGENGYVEGLTVPGDGDAMRQGCWLYGYRCDTDRSHYRSLGDLVESGYPDEELLALFLGEHCQ